MSLTARIGGLESQLNAKTPGTDNTWLAELVARICSYHDPPAASKQDGRLNAFRALRSEWPKWGISEVAVWTCQFVVRGREFLRERHKRLCISPLAGSPSNCNPHLAHPFAVQRAIWQSGNAPP
jgi:hypothetical protein